MARFLSLAAALPAAVTLFAPTVHAEASGAQGNGVLSFPITARHGAPLMATDLSKRQLSSPAITKFGGAIYTIDVKLGTPGQSVPVQFDTGSSELVVNPTCSQSRHGEFCVSQPRFTMSSSLVDYGVQGGITYEGGRGWANFEYIGDYVGIGSARITQQIFGAIYSSAGITNGVLGLSPDAAGWTSPYPFVMDSLVGQGLAQSKTFSLYLKGLGAGDGSVIFGGLDTKKYKGTLAKLPVIPASQSPDGFTRWWVSLDGISVTGGSGQSNTVYTKPDGASHGQPVVLDSGKTFCSLPTAIFTQLVAAFPSATARSGGLYSVDCDPATLEGSVEFTFGSKVISVPFADFIHHEQDGACYLGVIDATAASIRPALAATFLRAAYAVFDWDNRAVHIGQSADCGTEVVAIPAGPDMVSSVAVQGGCVPPVVSSVAPSSVPASSSIVSSSSVIISSSAVSSSSVVSSSAAASSSVVSSSSVLSSSSVAVSSSISTPPPSSASSVASSSVVPSSTYDDCEPEESDPPSSSINPSSVVPSSTVDSSIVPSSTPASSAVVSSVGSSSIPASSSVDSSIVPSSTPASSSIVVSSVDSSSIPASSTVVSSVDPSSIPASSTVVSSVDPSSIPASSAIVSSSSSDPVPSSEPTASSTTSSDPASSSDPAVSSSASTSAAHSYPTSSTTGSPYPITTPPVEYETSVYTSTSTYTVTKCPPSITNCPDHGYVTSSIVTITTSACKQSSAAYTLTIGTSVATISVYPVTGTKPVAVPTASPVPGYTPGSDESPDYSPDTDKTPDYAPGSDNKTPDYTAPTGGAGSDYSAGVTHTFATVTASSPVGGNYPAPSSGSGSNNGGYAGHGSNETLGEYPAGAPPVEVSAGIQTTLSGLGPMFAVTFVTGVLALLI